MGPISTPAPEAIALGMAGGAEQQVPKLGGGSGCCSDDLGGEGHRSLHFWGNVKKL